jgi:tRNA1Val (adenine37-N6)-methyltransferase
MANSWFQFKQFTIYQDRCAMKVTTDACLFGAWVGREVGGSKLEVRNILDIGTGTGLLSLMLAQNIDAAIDAIEIDKAAAEQAAENITASSWKERISIIHGDIKERPAILRNKYDVIISNPPFYENELTSASDQKNTAHHDSGLLLADLLTTISAILAPEGRFYLLLPYKRLAEAESLIQQHRLAISDITLVRQSTQHGYFRLFISGQHASYKSDPYIIKEISIRNEKNEYTGEFIELLKDYYLYL